MPTRTAEAVWEGDLREGQGTLRLGSGGPQWPYSFGSRFAEGRGTNPEELLGAAHAGCFSMALAQALADAGHPPRRIQTSAQVVLEKAGPGFAITHILLSSRADVPGIADADFQRLAEQAKTGCPVSKALGGTPIDLKATLLP